MGFIDDLISLFDIEIEPDPISKINPIVKTIKNIKTTEKPNTLTLYNVTAIGNSNKISKSKIKNNNATKKKLIWKTFLVCP